MTPPFPLAGVADFLLDQLRGLLPGHGLDALTGHQLMAERAQLLSLSFQPGFSAGGSCCFLPTRQSPIALNLPRDSDRELLSAWLETRARENWDWPALVRQTADKAQESLVSRGHELGLAIAPTGQTIEPHHVFIPTTKPGPVPDRPFRPRVIDLSALWAGPLASHLLWLAGAHVIKVESISRPDGARQGNTDFYALLNQGKHCVALDFATADGRGTLRALLESADIVIESSRPRALRQLGIDADAITRRNPGLAWISITGYGRDEPEANWIAYGDDAGVAAGLSDLMKEAVGAYEFAGDAIADPLTGLHVALAAADAWHADQGGLISIALTHVTAWAREQALAQGKPQLIETLSAWWQQVSTAPIDVQQRSVTARVAALGEHTTQVLAELEKTC